jgi:GTP-binding protein EngB required for normal cell division
MNKECLNIIISGKSGVGKSSFLNYIVGKDIFKTGMGDPITQSYFENATYTSPIGVLYQLFDTKGIEPDTTSECQKKIIEEINKHDTSDNIFDWIHTIYYCFAAPSKRIETFEIDFIKELLNHVSVVILLTKEDLVDDTTLNNLRKQIKEEIGTSIQVISVCSVEQRTRKGVSVKTGKEEVLKASFLGLWNKMAQMLPYRNMSSILNGNLETIEFKHEFPIDIVTHPLFELYNGIHLDIRSLCNFPNLHDFLFDSIDKEDRGNILKLMDSTISAIENLKGKINILDINSFTKEDEAIINKVFDFYKNINGTRPHILFTHKASEALTKLKNHDYIKDINQLIEKKWNVRDSILEVEDCVFFSSDEKNQVKNRFSSFRDDVQSIVKNIEDLINNFINQYQTELYQYGQCCIRDDDIVNENQNRVIETISDLTEKEKILFNSFNTAMKDGVISEDERSMIKELIESLNLSEDRSVEVMDFAIRCKGRNIYYNKN